MLERSVATSYDLDSIASRITPLGAPIEERSPERHAAVAAILRASEPGDEAEILLLQRAEHPSDPWSGHMALPGGRRDPGDETLVSTAVRETKEEIGIDLDAHGMLLARLPDVPAVARGKRTGLVVAVFVFALRQDVPLTPNHEVAAAMWTPLVPLARGDTAGTFPYVHEGKRLELPCFRVGERVVWGLTYVMLQSLFEAIRG
jgi:8-oxo-dGTP pyrophosphatase MutT (NUDIX family)